MEVPSFENIGQYNNDRNGDLTNQLILNSAYGEI